MDNEAGERAGEQLWSGADEETEVGQCGEKKPEGRPSGSLWLPGQGVGVDFGLLLLMSSDRMEGGGLELRQEGLDWTLEETSSVQGFSTTGRGYQVGG